MKPAKWTPRRGAARLRLSLAQKGDDFHLMLNQLRTQGGVITPSGAL